MFLQDVSPPGALAFLLFSPLCVEKKSCQDLVNGSEKAGTQLCAPGTRLKETAQGPLGALRSAGAL